MAEKTDWILRWEGKHPFFRLEAFFLGEKNHLSYGTEYHLLMGFSRKNAIQMYYSEEELKQISERSLELMKNKEKVKEYLKISSENNASLIKEIKKIIENKENLSNSELFEKYKKLIFQFQILLSSYDLSRPEHFSKVEKEIKTCLIEKGIKENKLNDAFITLTTSTEFSLTDHEQLDWLNLLLESKDLKVDEINGKLRVHQKKYGWIGTSEERKIWGIEHYSDLFKKESIYSKEELVKRKDETKNRFKEISEKQKEIVDNLKIDESILFLLEITRDLAYLRLNTRLTWVEATFLLLDIFKEISKRTKTNSEDLEYYSIDEMKELLVNETVLDEKVVSARKNAAVFILREENLQVFIGEEEVKRIEEQELEKKDLSGIKELRGGVANAGSVVGIVKIISALTEDQDKASNEMKEGEILVASMTRPHLISAMKKASAIITDEGGITCHAAIISRELGKPCIVGTGNATKVLKDGDLIEVDAFKGIIRKINPKN